MFSLFRLLYMFGPIGLVLGLGFQAFCAVHCIRAGRQQQWLWIVLVFPVIGGLIYMVVEVLPTLRGSAAVRRTNAAIDSIIDPNRDLRQHGVNFAISNNVQTTCQYAESLVRKRKYEDAISIYTEARKGLFQYDPLLLTGLARVYYNTRRFAESATVLQELIEHHPDQRRGDAHLLYATALEAAGRSAEAGREYKILADTYPGPEARCRYAAYLQKQGDEAQAMAIYHDIALVAQTAPKHYQRLHKEWIAAAQQALKAGNKAAR